MLTSYISAKDDFKMTVMYMLNVNMMRTLTDL